MREVEQDLYIACPNRLRLTSKDLDVPITVDGVPVGVITEVHDGFVYGVIWGMYAERFCTSGATCSVEIVGKKKPAQH